MKTKKGQAMFAVMVFLAIIFLFTVGLITYLANSRLVSQRIHMNTQALNIAEAGIDKAIWCLNNDDECGEDYNGETINFGTGQYSTFLSSIGDDYTVTSTGTVNNVEKVINVTVTRKSTTSDASFFYGVQVGAGGLSMDNNSYVEGNIYSNGSIDAANGSYVTGDAYVAGGTALTADQEHTTQNAQFIFGRYSSTEDVAQSFTPSVTEDINYITLYLKKVGSPANATVYITEDNNGKPATTPLADGLLLSSMITEDDFGWVDVSFNSNPELIQETQYWIVIDVGNPKSSRYYITGQNDQAVPPAGEGARYSTDWSSGSWTDAIGYFNFKTWMGGVENHIDNLIVGNKTHTCNDAHYASHHGDARAHIITNSWVECDAFYNSDISDSTIGRYTHPGSDDPPPEVMPISLQQIEQWKDAAEDSDIIEGDYTLINGETVSLGPVKITGNLFLDNNVDLTITGTIWVVGNITFTNNVKIRLDPGYSSNSGIILNDGKMIVNNNCVFYDSGTQGSYILMLSTNNSVDTGSPAVDIQNNAEAVIFYASKGMIKISNNAQIKEATGYKLHLDNNASVTYESGLALASFADGPGGIWTTQTSTWQVIE